MAAEALAGVGGWLYMRPGWGGVVHEGLGLGLELGLGLRLGLGVERCWLLSLGVLLALQLIHQPALVPQLTR